MKKLLAVITSFILTFSLLAVATSAAYANDAREHTYNGIVYNDNGVVTGYAGSSKTIEIPADINGTSIHTIGSFAFSYDEIDTVIIDKGIEYINPFAFFNSKITSVKIPSTIMEIGESAFADCKNLSQIYLETLGIDMADGCLSGTSHISFTLPCLFDLDYAKELISNAKKDYDFSFTKDHSIVKKTIKGENYDFCTRCGTTLVPADMPVFSVFSDVSNDSWYCRSVMESYNLGILNGKDSGKFDPDATMKLSEAAKIAAVLYEYKLEEPAFFDQNTGTHWYDTYVNFCVEVGIIENKSDFDYSKPATRAQMAYLFSRADMNYPYFVNGDFALANIPDVTLDTKYGNEIWDLYLKGIANGKDNYRYDPTSYIKRSEAATLVARFLDYDQRIVISHAA